MGCLLSKPPPVPIPDARFFHWLKDDLKNIRIQVINSELNSLKRGQILAEVERAEARIRPLLLVSKIEQVAPIAPLAHLPLKPKWSPTA
jgi:hypothetical protein